MRIASSNPTKATRGLLTFLLSALLGAAYPPCVPAQDALAIRDVQPGSAVAGLYEVWRLRFDLTQTYDNSYDPTIVDASVAFAGPSGQWRVMPAFWRGAAPAWEARLAPLELGPHSCLIRVSDAAGRSATAEAAFTAVPSGNDGFVGLDPVDPHYFRTGAGRPFFAVGHNQCWSIREAGYDGRLDRMRDAGENCTRIWMVAHVEQDIEWGNRIPGAVVGRYDEASAQEWDAVFDKLRARGIRAQLCLDSCHGWWFNWDSNWDDSPYNQKAGGFLARPFDFLTDPQAKALAQRRYRYIVARWSAYTSVFAWELFNEIDGLGAEGPFEGTYYANRAIGAAWHAEMADYLHRLDPYRRPVTTSFANPDSGTAFREVWELPEIDFLSLHRYTVDFPRTFPYLVMYARPLGKPVLFGEAGASDRTGNRLDLRDLIWGATLAGGGALAWDWDRWIHRKDLYDEFTHLSAYLEGEDWANLSLAQARVEVLAATGTAMVFGLASAQAAILWVRAENGTDVTGLALRMPQLAGRPYHAAYWDTSLGTVVSEQQVSPDPRGARLDVPAFTHDLAVKVYAVPQAPSLLQLR